MKSRLYFLDFFIEEIKDNFQAKGLAEAKEKLAELKLSKHDKQAYQNYLDDLRYEASLIKDEYRSGQLDGEKIGLQKGEEVGLEKGKIAEKLEIAKKMKASGMAIELIQQMTGLSEEEIQRIKSQP